MNTHSSAEEWLPQVYAELRHLAAYRMSSEPPGQTLQATALVHEAYLRLIRSGQNRWPDRAQFIAAAAEAMRRILVENARRTHRAKHGANWQKVELNEVDAPLADSDEHILLVHDALDALAREDPVKAEVVKLHFFVGFSHQETAEALGVSEKTVRRHWEYSRVWLYRQIRQNLDSTDPASP